jgi:hypothetical protein
VTKRSAGPGEERGLRLIPGGRGTQETGTQETAPRAPKPDPDLEPDPAVDLDLADLDVSLLIGSIYQDLAGQVRQVQTALEAELTVSGFLGVMAATIAVAGPAERAADATDAFLGQFVDHAREQATPEALAVLRTLRVLTFGAIREHADRAAWALENADVGRSRWMGNVGVPQIGRCWRYSNVPGDQVSVNFSFLYGQQEHLVSVLIDYHLGGGIKDCWVGDSPELAYQQISEMAENDPDVVLEQIHWLHARDIVVSALRRHPCPADDDQVQDVAEFGAVVRARVAHLGGKV